MILRGHQHAARSVHVHTVIPACPLPRGTMYEWEKAASMGLTTTATATSSGSSSHHPESAAAASPWAARDGRQRHPPPLAAGSRNGFRQSSSSSVEAEASPAPSSTDQRSVGIRSSSGTSSGGGGGGDSTNGDSREKSIDGDLIGDETAALAARPREGSGVTAAAAKENLSPPLPVAAPSEGVVIRVLISGAHASFLHMRVFPSTTAGQVCRKIGEKLRQLPAEQNEYVLIAIYARPARNVSSLSDTGGGSTGPGHRHSAGVADRGATVGGDEVDNYSAGYTAGGGRDERERRHDGRRRRRGEEEHQSSIRHILHTFRSEERLGEVRLGLPEPNSAGRPQNPANSHDRGARGDTDGPDRGRTDSFSTRTTAASPAAGGAADIDAALRAQGTIDNGGGGVRRVDEEETAGKLGVSRGNGGIRRGEGGEEGGGAGARSGRAAQAGLMWRSRWIYRERTAPALDPDELQVEVSGSDTSEDERRAGWIDLRGLGQGHYCGYLQKKSRSDPNLWRRRWCILADDRLWLLRSKSEQSGRRRGGGRSHSFSLALVPCVARAVNRPTAPSHCFELHSQNRVHTFRAESRAKQVAWVGTLQRHARQAAEDSYMSVAEHMVCDEEYARCRRLNVTLSSALGSRACDTLEADFYSSHAADRPVAGRGSSGGGGSVGGGWLPLPPPSPLPRTSGLFRRLPQGPPPTTYSASAAASAVRATPGLVSGCRSPLLPPPLPPPPPPLVRLADGGATESSARGAAGGGATVDSAERPWLAASEVRRAMRFCMKVHRYREICRPGSCVAFRKRWAYAADALEELCPGASTAAAADLSRHWNPPSPLVAVEAVSLPALRASGESAADGGPHERDESGIEAAGSRSGVDAAAAATANENRDEKKPSGKRSEAPATSPREDVVARGPSSTSAATSGEACSASLRTSTVLASPREADGEGRPTTLSGLSPPPMAAAVSASILPMAEAVALPTGDRPSPALLTAAAAAAATTTSATELVPRPSRSSTHQHALSLAAACSQETVVGVARDLREYVEAVTRSRASRAAKGGGGGGGGGGGKGAGPGGALGAGAGAAGENSLQEPPAEGLFDALLDQVLQALGDA